MPPKLHQLFERIRPLSGALLSQPLKRLSRLGVRARFSLLFYLVTLLSVCIVGYYGYTSASKAYREKAEELVVGYTTEVSQQIDSFIGVARQDILFISSFYALLRYSYWQDLGDNVKKHYWQEVTTDVMQDYLRTYSYTYKIRFFDPQGAEKFAVRRDPQTGQVKPLPTDFLYGIAGDPLFTGALALKQNALHVGPLDLNRELGQIEKPLVPVLRLASPVVGGNGVTYGVVASHVLADGFYDFIRKANKNDQGRSFYLVDAKGGFLFHPDKEKMFGQLLGHESNLADKFPGVLEQLQQQARGILSAHGHIIAFQHIYPNPADRSLRWTLVGAVPEEMALAELSNFSLVFVALLLGVVVLVFMTTQYFLGGLMQPLKFATRALEKLARGEVSHETIAYLPDDAIRQMLDSTEKLTVNMALLANQADTVARGDFSGSVQTLSEEDRLGNAINNMTLMLRENQARNARNSWLKDGITQLNQALTGDLGPQELADTAIGLVARYLEAGRGVFYVYREEERVLDLLGSYMHHERDALGNRFSLGEGAVGQVAREKKPIILNQVASHYPPITTGTASATPLHTYTYPLLREGQLYGVIELAAFEHFDELKQEFLAAAANTTASFLFTVLQRDQIKKLLAVSEEATRQAQEQSRRLQEVNARMEEQQQQLQQQTEELQQANSQMEEQQQQLQQQTEELMQTNSHMEEQQQMLEQQAQEMDRKNRELTLSREELDQRAKELELASQYKSEFLANMSHELRTPLNSVILLSKMLAMNEGGRLNEEDVKRASVVHRAGEELLRLINDILDLAKIESGKMELHPQTVHSANLLSEYHELFSETAREKGIQFIIEDQMKRDFVTDPDKLSQVIRNLLSNAFKFTKQGSVTLTTAPSGHPTLPVRISVTDTGIGIPEDKQKLVFEAFQQVDGSISREFGGTGLGLSISSRFAELLGGHIELKSTPGQGSMFSILLPLAPPERKGKTAGAAPPGSTPLPSRAPAAAADAGQLAAETQQVNDDRANLKSSDAVILVIDDEAVFGEAIAALNKGLGYKTLIALSGAEGLRMAKAYRPRGILLDLGLPDMDGSQVLHELKAARELRHIPVYIVSGRDKDAHLLQQGALGYLQKPVNEKQLAEAEEIVLTYIAPDTKNVLVVEGGSLTREMVASMVKADGTDIHSASDDEPALALLQETPCDLVMIDLERGFERCFALCRAIRAAHAGMPLILYGEHALTPEQEASLRQFTDSIVIKTAHAEKRIQENIERFLQGIAPAGNGLPAGLTGTPGGAKRLVGKRILVVDDDPRNLFVITSALEQEGAQVESALNGRKGLEQIRKSAPDLVFMDIMMPEMDGYEAIRAIKADPRMSKVPVIALTAKALKADREKAMKAGADDYLAKPVDYDVLINMAKVWCEEQPA